MWYGIWKLVHQSLQHKMFWVPQLYPYYPKIILIHLNYWIENLSMDRKMPHYKQTWYPMVPQKCYSRNINSELSSAVPIICIVILDQKLHPTQCSWFFDIPSILRKYHFFVQNDDKIFNFYKDAKTHPDFIMTCAIRRLKA